MPLFPAVLDNLRWDDLVRQGRAQLPLIVEFDERHGLLVPAFGHRERQRRTAVTQLRAR